VSIQCKLTISRNYVIPLHVVGMGVVILQLLYIKTTPYKMLPYMSLCMVKCAMGIIIELIRQKVPCVVQYKLAMLIRQPNSSG
jgi:hypothetical protein